MKLNKIGFMKIGSCHNRDRYSHFREDAPELLEGLMIGVCRVRMSLPRDVDFFFFILYLRSYVFNPNDWVFELIPLGLILLSPKVTKLQIQLCPNDLK